ncbi:MAG: hypothetical protein IAE95_04170 [Chitinophagaceae bacterium]|nr:hypothetical protein [Chitinophagaceae bacterium]
MILFLLAIISKPASAQTGALFIDNTANPCGVYVKMYAIESAYSTLCDIQANQFYVAAYSSTGWNSYNIFQNVGCSPCLPTGPDWDNITPGSISSSSTSFQWTDATFQFDCSSLPPGCSNGGGAINDGYFSSGGCHGTSTTWSGGCRNAAWHPGIGSAMQNVSINFW